MAGAKFDLGRVVSRTFKSIGDNLGLMARITGGLVCLPAVLLAWMEFSAINTARLMSANPNAAGRFAATFGAIASGAGGFGLLVGVSGILAQAAMIYAVVSSLGGRKIGWAEAVGRALQRILPLLLALICMGFMIVLGFFFFLVPGIMLLLRWSIALPALVVEKKGAFAAMGRSAELTKGHCWAIFGLCLAVWIVALAIGSAFSAVFLGSMAAIPSGSFLPASLILIAPLSKLVTTPILSAGVASLYYELRLAREGDGVEQLAEVFA